MVAKLKSKYLALLLVFIYFLYCGFGKEVLSVAQAVYSNVYGEPPTIEESVYSPETAYEVYSEPGQDLDVVNNAAYSEPDQNLDAVNNAAYNPETASKVLEIAYGDIFAPAVAVNDIPSKRDRYTRQYDLGDGRIQAEVSLIPQNYLDEKGRWQPIDTAIRPFDDSEFDLAAIHNDFKVMFGRKSSQAIKFEVNGKNVKYKVLNTNNVNGIVYGNKIIYQNAWDATDLEYQILPEKLKMLMVLKNPSAPTNFSFQLHMKGVTVYQEDNGQISFKDSSGKTIFFIEPMWVQEEGSNKQLYDRVNVSVNKKGFNYFIDIEVDPAGLNYPLIIDPSTLTASSSVLMYLQRYSYYENWYGGKYEVVYYGPFLYGTIGNDYFYDEEYAIINYWQYRTVAKFNLPSISDVNGITAAVLRANFTRSGSGITVNVHRMTSDVTSAKKWTDYGFTLNSTAGMSSTVSGTRTITANGVQDISILQLVKDWYNNVYPNYGIAIKRNTEGEFDEVNYVSFSSLSLVITYSAPPQPPTITQPTTGQNLAGNQTIKWNFNDVGDSQASAQVQVATDSGFTNLVLDVITGTSSTQYTINPALADGTYYVRVKTKDTDNYWSNWSNPVNFTVQSLSLTINTPNMNFGNINPVSPKIISNAINLTVSSGSNWSLTVQSTNFTGPGTILANTLAWSPAGVNNWSGVSATASSVLSNQSPTTNRNLLYDLKLEVPWTAPIGGYSGTVTYILTPV